MTHEKQTPTEPDVESWDPNEWLAGSTSTRRTVRIYAAAGLLAEVDRLEQQLRVARGAADEDRGLNDRSASPQALEQQIVELHRRFQASGRDIVIEGRSDEARKRATTDLPADASNAEKDLHYVADAIVSPAGITLEWLRDFSEKHQRQYRELVAAYIAASYDAPQVTVPFFGGGSAPRRQGTPS